MFQENIDLTPIGPDGDEMIRRMADRLVAVDLLTPASLLLAYRSTSGWTASPRPRSPRGWPRCSCSTSSRATRSAPCRNSEITGLPDDVVHARLILEARAFAALKQYDNALDLIAVDQSPETVRLRADIYWESGNWAVAGQEAGRNADRAWRHPAGRRRTDAGAARRRRLFPGQ